MDAEVVMHERVFRFDYRILHIEEIGRDFIKFCEWKYLIFFN